MIQLLIGVAIATIYVVILFAYEKKNVSTIYKMLAYVFMTILIQVLGTFLQETFGNSINIPKECYSYLIYAGKAFLPTMLLLFALTYENPKVDLKKFVWLFFIPVFIITTVWSNSWHHLFFTNYLAVISASKVGVLYYVYVILAYSQIVPAILIIIRSSIDRGRLFSPQTLLLILAFTIPIVPRIISVIHNIAIPEYIMSIAYMFMALVVSLDIIKYNVLNAVPIALKSVIDIMSDAFVVISPDGTIVDVNRSFMSNFTYPMNLKINKNIYDVIKYEGIKDMKYLKQQIIEAQDKGVATLQEYHITKQNYDRYFEVQIQPIKARTSKGYIATLMVFRDITAQKENIDIIVKRENLAVIGELAGGVAHDINTPISAIKSGLLMLRDTVQTADEKQLISSMSNSADKISNLANSLKNQIRNLGSSSDTEFNLVELVQDLYVIMHNDFAKNNIRLNINSESDVWLTGNTAKLAQVFTNVIRNSIEAYGNKGGIIDVNIYKDDADNVVVMIEDWAGGITESVQPYIFKKIIRINDMPTTGIGLYLAYSVIKGDFSGDIKFTTVKGKGTKIYITLPNK